MLDLDEYLLLIFIFSRCKFDGSFFLAIRIMDVIITLKNKKFFCNYSSNLFNIWHIFYFTFKSIMHKKKLNIYRKLIKPHPNVIKATFSLPISWLILSIFSLCPSFLVSHPPLPIFYFLSPVSCPRFFVSCHMSLIYYPLSFI